MQFNERKAAQMAAYLLKHRGGSMSHLKLQKLLYLADRESMAHHGAPISGDRLVSMPHGPVLSQTLNLMDGDVESRDPSGWDHWISDKQNYELALRESANKISREQFDSLSDADISILDKVFSEFGRMSRWELRDWTHNHCAEWNDPNGSSFPIEYRDVYEAVGCSKEEADQLSKKIEHDRDIDRLFSSL